MNKVAPDADCDKLEDVVCMRVRMRLCVGVRRDMNWVGFGTRVLKKVFP